VGDALGIDPLERGRKLGDLGGIEYPADHGEAALAKLA